MNLLQAAVLGATQGLSEFIPISSSGHLILVPWAFGWEDVLADEEFNKTFDVALHIGTFAGAALYLRRDIARLVRGFFRGGPDRRMAWYVGLSAIPASLVGAALNGFIDHNLGEPWQIATLLAVFGLVLWVVDARAPQRIGFDGIGRREATAMAVGQALALAPGVSRSGITMTVGRALGVNRDAAARFSFLISLPVTLGAAVYEGLGLLGEPDPLRGQAAAFGVGILCSAITGGLAVAGLLAFLRRYGNGAFAAYRLLVAAAAVAMIVSGARGATI